MMFATALFVIIATAHVLATLKILARNETVVLEESTARQIRLVEAVASNPYLGFGYYALCLFLIWFSAYRRYPIWTGWIIFATLTAPWILYLKACGLVIHHVVTN